MAVALGFGLGCAGRLRSLLELDADALGILGLFVAIPGGAFDPDLGDVAAEAAVTFEEAPIPRRRHLIAAARLPGRSRLRGCQCASTSRVRAGSVITPSMAKRSGAIKRTEVVAGVRRCLVSQLVRHTSAESAPTGIGLVG